MVLNHLENSGKHENNDSVSKELLAGSCQIVSNYELWQVPLAIVAVSRVTGCSVQ